MEQAVQGNVIALINKLVYKKNAPWISKNNYDAAFGLTRNMNDIAMGSAFGAMIGGGRVVKNVTQPFVNKLSLSKANGISNKTNTVLPNYKSMQSTKENFTIDNTSPDAPVFVTDYERLLYELAEEKRKETEIEQTAKRLFGFEEGETWGDVGDIVVLRNAYVEDAHIKNNVDDMDIKDIKADIETVYKTVSELPEEIVGRTQTKNSYMDKVLPSGKTVRQLAKTMAKEGIVSGVATGLVYAANGEDFVDGFVNGTVSGVLSSGVSESALFMKNEYGLLVAGEILGESIEYLMHAYTNESDETQEEVIKGLAVNAVNTLIRCVPKAEIRAIINDANKENSIARQFMEYDNEFGENLELFWNQLIDILTSLEEDESGE